MSDMPDTIICNGAELCRLNLINYKINRMVEERIIRKYQSLIYDRYILHLLIFCDCGMQSCFHTWICLHDQTIHGKNSLDNLWILHGHRHN